MKTRVWRAALVLHDTPGCDADGQPEAYLTRAELIDELRSIGPQCYGLTVKDMELRLVGHIPAPPTTNRPRVKYSIELVPHKGRGRRKVVES